MGPYILRLWPLILLWSVCWAQEYRLLTVGNPEDSERVISSGDSLHLKCESKQQIRWTTPQHETLEEDLPEISVNHTEDHGSEYPFISHLTIFHLNATDTGYYYCRFKKNKNLSDWSEIANIYIYVNDSETLLAANQSFMHLTSIQYHDVTIPCKPTSPDVKVTLSKDGEDIIPSDESFVSYNPKLGYEFSSINFQRGGLHLCKGSRGDEKEEIHIHLKIEVNEHGFSYDPREGFLNRSPAIIDSGSYTCFAERGDKSQYLLISLVIISHTNDVPKPNIDDKNAGHVVVGGDLKLDCIVKMQISVIFNLEWSVPNEIANETGRLVIGDSVSTKKKQNNQEYIEGRRSLTVHNVTNKDQGYYNCTVIDHTHKKNSHGKYVRVFDANITYINFTVQGDVSQIVVRAGEQSIQWVVHVAAHPSATLYWYDPRDKEIQNITKKYEVQTSPTQTKLKIYDLEMSDAGVYQLRGINSKMEKALNLTVVVNDAPAVELIGQMYYMYKQTYRVNCTVVGFPVPKVMWLFQTCEEGFKRCQDQEERISKTLYNETMIGKGKKISVLEIKATKSGNLICKACNSVGCAHESTNFMTTDVLNGFHASILPPQPLIGDDVKLTCGVSRYNYSDSIEWYKKNPVTSNYELITLNSGYNLQRSGTQFSRRAEIMINGINMTHAGIYQCKVFKISDETEEQEVNVTVQKIQVPVFVESSMNGSVYSVEPGAKVEWKCIAKGVPIPEVIWYKDNQLLNVEKQNLELRDDNQTLKITYANYEDEGKYECRVKNKGGMIEGFATLALNDNRGKSNVVLIALVVFGVSLSIVVIYLIVRNNKEKKLRKELMYAGLGNFENGALENINPELGVDDQAELLPYDKKWEFPREKLKLGKQLGSGAFGVVMKGDAFGIIEGEAVTTVAVKMVKRNAEYTHIKALASELKIMVHLGKHLNVVNLLGACTKHLTKRELLVIVEYCRFGNLQNYLLRHREDFIDEIDPSTGKVVLDRGMEQDMQPDPSKTAVKGDSRIKYAALSFSTSASQGSVQDYRAAPMMKEDSAFCNDNMSQTVNTDMSLVSMSPSGEECGVTGGSGCGGPGWHTNYKGDYGRRDVRPICTSDLICWAFQVARGIDYLASRRVLHGDLAARNILLAEDNVVKICDFGLAKSMYKSDNYKKKGDGPLPVKWMAIESIRDGVFSTQSDVWSFGIVLWEFFSLARTPYPGMEADEKLYSKLMAGYRMEKPQYATDEIYSVMLDCWKVKPSERPTFSVLTEILGGMLEETVKRHYIDLNSPYMMMNTQDQEGKDYLGMMCEPSYANAMREMTPEREYVNMPQSSGESPAMDYMTMTSPPADDVSESGYLCMRSGSTSSTGNPSVIFSPRPSAALAFNFEVPSQQNKTNVSPKLRVVERKGAEGPELSPMLPIGSTAREGGVQKEGSLDSGMGSPNSYFNPSYRSLPNTNGHVVPNNEMTNYVNVPANKARDSNRSSGFQSEAGDMSPMPEKNFPSFEIPLKIST